MIQSVELKCYFIGSKSKGDVVQVTWDNVEELEAYIAKLKKAADQLSIENRRLRRCHFDISDKVRQYSVILMHVDVSVATTRTFFPCYVQVEVIQFRQILHVLLNCDYYC